MSEYPANGKSKGKLKYGNLFGLVSSIGNVSDPICKKNQKKQCLEQKKI